MELIMGLRIQILLGASLLEHSAPLELFRMLLRLQLVPQVRHLLLHPHLLFLGADYLAFILFFFFSNF